MYRPWPGYYILYPGLPSFIITANPNPFSVNAGADWTTGNCAAMQSQGPANDGPLVFSWSQTSTTRFGGNVTANSPNSATTTFSGLYLGYGNDYTAVMTCQATNSFNQTAIVNVPLNIHFTPPPITINWVLHFQYQNLAPGQGLYGSLEAVVGGGIPPYNSPHFGGGDGDGGSTNGGGHMGINPTSGMTGTNNSNGTVSYFTTVAMAGQPGGTTDVSHFVFTIYDSAGQYGDFETQTYWTWHQ